MGRRGKHEGVLCHLLPVNSGWTTVSRDKDLSWPNRSAHTRAGHVDHEDDLRTLAPHVRELEKNFDESTINAVLDKAVEDYGLVVGQKDLVGVFAKEFERTKAQLPPHFVEYLQRLLEYNDLLYYEYCLEYTIAAWRKQERRRKYMGRWHLAWIVRYLPQGSCIIRCTCELPKEQVMVLSNATPTVQATGQEAIGQQACTSSRTEIPTVGANDESPPPLLICPITLELLEDPVVAADGFTYSRAAIQRWLRSGKNRSPMTNQRLAHKHLTPSNTIRSMVLEWRETNKPGFP